MERGSSIFHMPTYRIVRIDGLIDTRRSVVFLECLPEDKFINALSYYVGAKDKIRLDFLGRFGHWLSGQTCDKYFHGWPNEETRRQCFVFKKEAGSVHQRLYGFLTHPKPEEGRFQACVLVHHTQKTDETDPNVMKAVEALRLTKDVQDAVRAAFFDSTKLGSVGAQRQSGDRKNCKHQSKALDRKKRR